LDGATPPRTMKVSGATFVRNAVKFDYPVVESITSILPVCDEVVVNVGHSDDGTRDLIASITDPRIIVVESTWDSSKRSGGSILSEQTDIALRECRGDWIFYIQADEVLHERYLQSVKEKMIAFLEIPEVEGLLFGFKHFYGSYHLFKHHRKWYRHEVRIIRNHMGITSWRDAQGFRLSGRKLRVAPAGAEIYHYGWARHPRVMMPKQKNLDRFWHDDSWIEDRYRKGFNLDMRHLEPFLGTHPSVMKPRIDAASWDPYRQRRSLKAIKPPVLRRLLSVFDTIGEYRNYVLIERAGRHGAGD
jgi:glycosyltransferase involved in cell wall biosynthesis